MDIIEFFRAEQKRLHEWTRLALSDLTTEEWNKVPTGTGNNIAFQIWHSARTEDNILHFILQGRSPLWNEGNWHERLKLPPRAQGTGMSTGEPQTLQIDDPALLMTYVEQVWRAFETYLAGISDGGTELSARIVKVNPLGEMPAIRVIGQICISHLFTHYGEISLLRGLFGKQGTIL